MTTIANCLIWNFHCHSYSWLLFIWIYKGDKKLFALIFLFATIYITYRNIPVVAAGFFFCIDVVSSIVTDLLARMRPSNEKQPFETPITGQAVHLGPWKPSQAMTIFSSVVVNSSHYKKTSYEKGLIGWFVDVPKEMIKTFVIICFEESQKKVEQHLKLGSQKKPEELQ